MRPLILLSNDDGVSSSGISALRSALETFADVVVCAPANNQSASSHSLTLNSILRLSEHGEATFSIDGTPADCVYVALHAPERILPRRPDLVVSGMNHGPNLGHDVVYSGTVAAAREGAQNGIPSVAVSAHNNADKAGAAAVGAAVACHLWKRVSQKTFAAHGAPLLNVNVPVLPTGKNSWKLCATRLGQRRYQNEVVFRNDPRRREYLWIGGSNVHHGQHEGTDTAAWDAGDASVTPLTLELTEPKFTALASEVVESHEGGASDRSKSAGD